MPASRILPLMEDARDFRRCAVLGSPIEHSLSPVLHHAAYDALDLAWTYTRYEVDEAGLASFLDGLDSSWRGLSLTMPLKRIALACCSEVSPLAVQVAAVNTILLGDDGRRVGDNTDVPALVAALQESGVTAVPEGAVLGGGATARSAIAALAQLAGSVVVYVRSPSRAEDLLATADAVGVALQLRRWDEREQALSAPVLVATTPAGTLDDLAGSIGSRPGALLDVVYGPWPTPLAAAWDAAGGTVTSGLDLLAHQAALQVQLMTGRAVPVDVLRRAGRAAMADRPH